MNEGYVKGYRKGYRDAKENVIRCIAKQYREHGELIPSWLSLGGVISQERPQGVWLAREDMDYLDENKAFHNHFQCNQCGLIHDFIDGHTSQYNFCPNCGTYMRFNNELKEANYED